jgi:L1 cell adhesion molecule
MGKFNDGGKCSPCHENCVDGCTGPENNIGPSGCSSCDKAIIKSDGEVVSLMDDKMLLNKNG